MQQKSNKYSNQQTTHTIGKKKRTILSYNNKTYSEFVWHMKVFVPSFTHNVKSGDV